MKRLLISFWLVLGAGCSLNPSKPVAVHDFGLSSLVNPQLSSAADIKVTAPPWLEDNYIHYRLLYSEATQVRFYNLDRWIVPPSELIAQQFISSGKINKPLHIRLISFEQQFDNAKQARVVLQFTVEAYSADHKNLLGSQLIQLQQASRSPDALGAVAGLAHLTQQAVNSIQDWLTTLPTP